MIIGDRLRALREQKNLSQESATFFYRGCDAASSIDCCSGARGRKCRTMATWRGVRPQSVSSSNTCSDPETSARGRFLSGDRGGLDAVNVRSILSSNQFQIVGRNDFPFRVVHFQSARGFPGAFVQNLKTFLAEGEEITFSPLAQSNDDR